MIIIPRDPEDCVIQFADCGIVIGLRK